MAANNPDRQGGNIVDVTGFEDRFAAARALYEGTPGMTFKMCAEKTGMGKSTLERRAAAEGWKKLYGNLKPGEMTADAQRAADLFNRLLDEYGPEITEADKALVTAEVTHQVAVDIRGEMLDRHRREWAAPRAMSAEAVRMRETNPEKAFDRAKMAKITAETLKIIQDGERKAHGIDAGDLPPGAVVVIDRSGV